MSYLYDFHQYIEQNQQTFSSEEELQEFKQLNYSFVQQKRNIDDNDKLFLLRQNKNNKYHIQCNKCKNYYEEDIIQIDHIVPIFVTQRIPFYRDVNDISNLQCLCANCHSIKSRKETRDKKYNEYVYEIVDYEADENIKYTVCMNCYQFKQNCYHKCITHNNNIIGNDQFGNYNLSENPFAAFAYNPNIV